MTKETARAATIDALKKYDLVYIATPYSKYPKGMGMAFVEASSITCNLMLAGVKGFSPIAHTHPLAIYGNVDPGDHSVWLPFDEAMMKKSDAVCIVMMDGWKESRGINYEIEYFTKAKKPIYYLAA